MTPVLAIGCQTIVALEAKPTSAPNDAATPWSCLETPATRAREDRNVPITLRRRYLAFNPNDTCVDARGTPGAIVKACNALDVPCASPAFTAKTDCEGYASLTVYQGFVGFLEVTPPRPEAGQWSDDVATCFKARAAENAADPCLSGVAQGRFPLPSDMMPLLDMVVPPPVASDDEHLEIDPFHAHGFASASVLTQLLGIVGKTFEPELAHWLGLAVDCRGDWAGGVSVALESPGPRHVGFYADSVGVPSFTATETSSRGDVGFLNVDPGPTGTRAVTVKAARRTAPTDIGTYTIVLRAGHLTRMDLAPLPR